MAEEGLRVLVTGADGCIGAWVLKGALARGWSPVALDLARQPIRPRLVLSDDELATIPWISTDIVDSDAIMRVFGEFAVDAVIHLGALQVPFCAQDPVAGARVNVVGTVNLLEAARRNGIRRFSFASSVGVHGKPSEGNPYLATLYGAYKSCTEEVAGVFWQDWKVSSVCLRPGVVYGVGRDQGMTAAPTKAILAAAVGRPYSIPFSGELPFLYVSEVAGAFLAAVAKDPLGAHILDLNGRTATTARFRELVLKEFPAAQIALDDKPFPFPADLSDAPVQRLLGDYGVISLEDGVRETAHLFRRLTAAGRVNLAQLDA